MLAAATDRGRKRRKNEDAVLAVALPGGASLLAVADGVGGGRAGEVASVSAIDGLSVYLASVSLANPQHALSMALQAINRDLWERGQSDPNLEGMSTTLVAAMILGGEAWIANVGDSRAYLLDGIVISQLTQDHSLVAEQVRRGVISEGEARRSPSRNVITRCLGCDESVDVDVVGPVAMLVGSRLLLCSDGLHAVVPEEEIVGLAQATSPDEATTQLVAAANARGGPDNISVAIYEG
jgi:protein phosphatase